MVQYWYLDCNLPHFEKRYRPEQRDLQFPNCARLQSILCMLLTYYCKISTTWKIQHLHPKHFSVMEASKVQPQYHASQIAVNEPQAHTRVFLFHFLSERKKKILTEKKKQSERPILTALTQRLNSEIYLCCRLRHRQLLSLCNAPK